MHVGAVEHGGAYALPIDSLVQHAVCFGATGSGKTGFCTVLLEEVASAGVPVLVLDPKGDLANLALRYPEPTAQALAPWVDPGLARREGTDAEGLGGQIAQRMRDGWRADGVDETRRARWAAVPVEIWTPGSKLRPVDVLGSLMSPSSDADDAAAAAAGLLLLVGHEGDPMSDPAQVVLTHVLIAAQSSGTSDLASWVTGLVDPPFDKVGVFPLETFMPRSKRLALAIKMNAILAAPRFAVWGQGPAVDPASWLARPGVHVFSLHHLADAERQWFVGSLLSRVVTWSRTLPGTSALRALVYLDEAFGFAPPHPADPPTKRPLMTLLKQARAVGVGVVIATQNPVDLDYKLTANAGTWIVGQLRTDQDRGRVIDGLAGVGVDRSALMQRLAALAPRAFLVRPAGEPTATVVRSRFAMSFLRGPMTEGELTRWVGSSDPPRAAAAPHAAPRGDAGPPAGTTPRPPPSPGGLPYLFLDPDLPLPRILADRPELRAPPGAFGPVYLPAIRFRVRLRFDEGREIVEERDDERIFFPLDASPPSCLGDPGFQPGDLRSEPPDGAYAALPGHLDEAREIERFRKGVADLIQRGETARVFAQADLRLTSRAGETRDAFVARVRAAVEARIDEDSRVTKSRIERDVVRLEERRTRLERDLPNLRTEAGAAVTSEVVSAGETLLGFFFGRKKSLTSAVHKRKQTRTAQDRVSRVEGDIQDLNAEIYDLGQRVEDEILASRVKHERLLDAIEERPVALEREDVQVEEPTVVWLPRRGGPG